MQRFAFGVELQTFLNQALNSQKSTACDPTWSWSALHHMTAILSSSSAVISVVLTGKVQFMLEHGFSVENIVQEWVFYFFISNENGRRAAVHRLDAALTVRKSILKVAIFPTCPQTTGSFARQQGGVAGCQQAGSPAKTSGKLFKILFL